MVESIIPSSSNLTAKILEYKTITAMKTDGVYCVSILMQYPDQESPELVDYISYPDDPYGLNPRIRAWLEANPDFPIQPYVPPAELTPDEKRLLMPTLSARQLRLGLIRNGISLATISAAISAMPEGESKEEASVEWEYATTYERTHALISTIGLAVNLTPEQIDTMWLEAANI